jgi:hypothetical protein
MRFSILNSERRGFRASTGWSVSAAIVGTVAFTRAANAMPLDSPPPTYSFEMSVPPDAEASPMIKIGDGFGDLAAGDFGAPNFGGLQDGTNGRAGTARFVDSGSHGNDGYYIQGFTGAWIVDMRISAEAEALPVTARCLSIREAAGKGRGVAIEPNTGGDSMVLNFVSGAGIVGTVIVPDNPMSTSNFHLIRLSLPNDGTVLVYDLENPLVPFGEKTLLGTVNLGGTGFAGELTTGGGFALNSLLNNGTSFSKFSADWVRITIPEPVTLTLLVLGAGPMVIGQRR